MLTVIGTARSSPGVTTACLALASCIDDATVIEADPDGGVIAARFWLARDPSLASLATAARGALGVSLAEHAQLLPGGQSVVVGLASGDRAVALWRSAGQRLAAALSQDCGVRHLIVDAGRLSPTAPTGPLVAAADLVLVVARPILEDLHALVNRLEVLQPSVRQLQVLLVGDAPYSAADVTHHLGVPVIGVLADDPRAADALAGRGAGVTGRWIRRSALARSARTVAASLLALAPDSPPASEFVPTGVSS